MYLELQIILAKIYDLDGNKVKDMKHLCNLYRKWYKSENMRPPKLKIINLKQFGFDKQYLYIAHDMHYDGHDIMNGFQFQKHVIKAIEAQYSQYPIKTIKFWKQL